MRTPFCFAVLVGSALAAASPACAARLNIPDDNSVAWSAYSSNAIERPWATQRPEAQLTELHIADLIATKLGVAKGSAELFSYRLENAPSNATILRGQIDGGGVKLKLTW
jgi:hypothetical protein